MHKLPRDIPRHTTKSLKLLAVVSRIQRIMITENLTPDEIVACAEAVRDSYVAITSEPRARIEATGITIKGINDEA